MQWHAAVANFWRNDMADNHDLHLLAELSANIDTAQQAFQRAAD
jgi:hypothetical protein